MHLWWARRPLASSRAINYAALIPAPPAREIDKKLEFVAELAVWESAFNRNLMEKARKELLEANAGVTPKLLDPFAGGGSIPLEALRLGCETYAYDYNPVATLVLRCTLEYPQKYGRQDGKQILGFTTQKEKNQFLEDVEEMEQPDFSGIEERTGKVLPQRQRWLGPDRLFLDQNSSLPKPFMQC